MDKYLNPISSSLPAGTSVMDLNGRISQVYVNTPHVVGQSFARYMRNLYAMGKNVVVYINSDGGDVDAGWDIVQAIRDTDANTHVVGRAGSMSGIALLFGKHRTANQFSRIMLHGASGPGGKETENAKAVNDQFKAILKQVTSLPQTMIDSIVSMRGSQSMMFTAKEALKYGIIDEIVSASREAALTEKVDIESCEENELYVAYASLQNNVEPKPKSKMSKVNATLDLNADASEESQVSAINKIKAEAAKSKSENEKVQADLAAAQEKIKTLEAEKAERDKTLAVSLVDAAVEAGKISAEKKDAWLTKATEDYDGTKELIDSIPAAEKPKVSAQSKTTSHQAAASEKKVTEIKSVDDVTPALAAQIIRDGQGLDAYDEEIQNRIFDMYDEYNKNPEAYTSTEK